MDLGFRFVIAISYLRSAVIAIEWQLDDESSEDLDLVS
jgi:hypothetical protein